MAINLTKKKLLADRLTGFLEQGPDTLTTANFKEKRSLVEKTILETLSLGINIDDIVAEYQQELASSSGGPDNPSEGRLGYIKGHLKELLNRIKALDA